MTYVYHGLEMYRKAVFSANYGGANPSIRHMYLVERSSKAGVNIKIHLPGMIELNRETSICPTVETNYFSPPGFYVYSPVGFTSGKVLSETPQKVLSYMIISTLHEVLCMVFKFKPELLKAAWLTEMYLKMWWKV